MKRNLSIADGRLLLFSVFILSLCGIIYELVLGSLATYLLGNPVQQYSITIGIFLSSMGLGSYLSRFLSKDLLKNFIRIEIALGLVGGVSILILNYIFSFSLSYYLLHIFFLVLIGTLVGLEIPIITRILKKYGKLKDIISNVLTLDYMGGLAGSLLFPLLLFPHIGRMLTSVIIGIINISVAIIVIVKIDYIGKRKSDYLFPVFSLMILFALVFYSDNINYIIQKRLYYDDIVFSKRSKIQEIVLTRNGEDFRLYLDGSLQFSTYDEYRYHEMLVYPVLFLNSAPDKSILILGGGDGIAAREFLKSNDVDNITLVELDPVIIDLAKNNPSFRRINADSLNNKKVNVVIGDAYEYLVKNRRKFDIIAADFPDPHDEAISKLYSVEFFFLIRRAMKNNGLFVTQSTSPLFAKDAFWCINNTLKKVFKRVAPYHVYVPTFGDWGFNIASNMGFNYRNLNDENIKTDFYSKETFINSLHFSKDSSYVKTKINTFNKPVLYTYYIQGWKNTDY